MIIKPEEKQQYYKQSDKVESYLKAIIERFFLIELEFTRETNEAIMVEIVKRTKEECLKFTNWIFSFNSKMGNIKLSILFFDGEPEFKKHTAYNKDFYVEGETNDSDTIVMGNDPRLYDEREPLPHIHQISDFNGLQEALSEINFCKCSHAHSNKENALDKITYSGTSESFDLILLEQKQITLDDYLIKFKDKETELFNKTKEYINKVELIYTSYNDSCQSIIEYLTNYKTWFEEAKEYIDNQIYLFENNFINKIKDNYVKTQEFTEDVENARKKGIQSVFKKEYNITNWTKIESQLPILPDDVKRMKSGVDKGKPYAFRQAYMLIPENLDPNDPSISMDSADLQAFMNNSTIIGRSINDGGLNTWSYNASQNTFIQSANTSVYTGFISANLVEAYAHRTTLQSTDSDNDAIGIILCHIDDGTTGKSLHLDVHTGGFTAWGSYGSNSKSYAMLNLFDYGKIYEDVEPQHPYGFTFKKTIKQKQLGPAATDGWRGITGVTLFINRGPQCIRIWIKFDNTTIWSTNAPTSDSTPDIEYWFNEEDGTDIFENQPVKYGYTSLSQRDSKYKGTKIAIVPFANLVYNKKYIGRNADLTLQEAIDNGYVGFSWKEASDACINEDGFLARVKTNAQRHFIEDVIEDYGYKNLWIGGHRGPMLDLQLFPYNNKVYGVYKQVMTWTDAEALCQSQGGHLAMPKNMNELNKLMEIATAQNINGLWLGGYTTDEELAKVSSANQAQWYWADGTKITASQTNWNSGEPNNSQGNERYLEIYCSGDHAGLWNDLKNNSTAISGFICEFDYEWRWEDNSLITLSNRSSNWHNDPEESFLYVEGEHEFRNAGKWNSAKIRDMTIAGYVCEFLPVKVKYKSTGSFPYFVEQLTQEEAERNSTLNSGIRNKLYFVYSDSNWFNDDIRTKVGCTLAKIYDDEYYGIVKISIMADMDISNGKLEYKAFLEYYGYNYEKIPTAQELLTMFNNPRLRFERYASEG